MTKRPMHPADAAELALIPNATRFIASLFHDGLFIKREAATLAEARTAAATLMTGHPTTHRKATVYAIMPDDRQVLVPGTYQPQQQEKIMPAKKTSKPNAKAKAAKPARKPVKAAEAGKLPPAPDFSAKTHERFRGKLAEVVALVKAGDVKGLKAYKINPISSSPKAIDRYRNLAIMALQARS